MHLAHIHIIALPLAIMQVCKSEDFLKLGEEDVREMLRDEEVTPTAAAVVTNKHTRHLLTCGVPSLCSVQ